MINVLIGGIASVILVVCLVWVSVVYNKLMDNSTKIKRTMQYLEYTLLLIMGGISLFFLALIILSVLYNFGLIIKEVIV